jgi:predicted HicB family RNase H-like nuclease
MKDTRLVVLVEAKQMKALRAAAKKQKISLGEVVRRAIDKAVK